MQIDEKWGYEHYPYKAGFLKRTLAYIIDIFIIGIPIGILYYVLAMFYNITLSEFALPFVLAAYRVLMHWLKGATIGKFATQLRVQNAHGKRITLQQSVLREGIYIGFVIVDVISSNSSLPMNFYETILSTFSLLMLIDVLWALGRNRNTLHDIISKTYCYSQ